MRPIVPFSPRLAASPSSSTSSGSPGARALTSYALTTDGSGPRPCVPYSAYPYVRCAALSQLIPSLYTKWGVLERHSTLGNAMMGVRNAIVGVRNAIVGVRNADGRFPRRA
ncbi:hypothetical protein PIB30_096087 [Stylosanthes scabra]|uniref:Uncharacterized protein n=1 Tax=Stylosanthes scabra TaxID=79078 RepID=A0ABU6TWR8_9FABA|nr:hypothetical protein [Stylosanthes scabra]